MKHRVLLPTDFSDNAWSAIDYALKLFNKEECRFYLLNSIALKATTMSNFSKTLLKVMEDNAHKDILELKHQIETAHSNPQHEFDTLVSTFDLYDAIKLEVYAKKIDLVVMGTKGATGAKEIFFGSNTVRVIKKLKSCPLLIVPDEYDYVIPRQIAFPTAFKVDYTAEQLDPLKKLLKLHDSKIRVLHITEDEELSSEQERHYEHLKHQLEDYKYSFHWMPYYSTKESEIKEFIQDLEIDLLAMINHKRSCMDRITREPVIKKIGFHPVIPFLVIPT